MLALFWLTLKARNAKVYVDAKDKTTLYYVDGRSIMKFEGVSRKDAFLCLVENLRLADYELIVVDGTQKTRTVPGFIATL